MRARAAYFHNDLQGLNKKYNECHRLGRTSQLKAQHAFGIVLFLFPGSWENGSKTAEEMRWSKQNLG